MTTDSHGSFLASLAGDLERIVQREIGLPLYLVSASEIPSDARAQSPGRCLGWQADWLGSLLEPWLSSRGLWRGPGVGIILRDDTPGFVWARPAILGTCLHELGHAVFSAVANVDVRPVAAVFARPVPTTIDAVPIVVATADAPSHAPASRPWDGHGATWIRIVTHLAWRARQHGLPVGLADCGVAGRAYGLSPASRYACALADEPRAREGESLVGIAYTPAPRPFAALWQRDTGGVL
ncbi:MAG: hypothetical protein ACYC35_27560 [Pirellulales bacterium]